MSHTEGFVDGHPDILRRVFTSPQLGPLLETGSPSLLSLPRLDYLREEEGDHLISLRVGVPPRDVSTRRVTGLLDERKGFFVTRRIVI